MEFFLYLRHRFQNRPLSLSPSEVTLRLIAEIIVSELRFPVEKCAFVGVQFCQI